MALNITIAGDGPVILNIDVPFSTFAALSTSYLLYTGDNADRIMSIECLKHNSVFDAGDVLFGTGTSGARLSNIMPTSEVAATTLGTSLGAAWRGGGNDHINRILAADGNFRVYARCTGTLPTSGLITLRMVLEKALKTP